MEAKKENHLDLLERINAIISQCDPHDQKSSLPAKNFIHYISLAYNKKLLSVPETYRPFAQQMRHHYGDFKKLKTEPEKIQLLQKIVGECLETIKMPTHE